MMSDVWLHFLWKSDVWLRSCLRLMPDALLKMPVLMMSWMMQRVQVHFPHLSVCVCRFPWFRLRPGSFLFRWND